VEIGYFGRIKKILSVLILILSAQFAWATAIPQDIAKEVDTRWKFYFGSSLENEITRAIPHFAGYKSSSSGVILYFAKVLTNPEKIDQIGKVIDLRNKMYPREIPWNPITTRAETAPYTWLELTHWLELSSVVARKNKLNTIRNMWIPSEAKIHISTVETPSQSSNFYEVLRILELLQELGVPRDVIIIDPTVKEIRLDGS
jgi:hypothetical protein